MRNYGPSHVPCDKILVQDFNIWELIEDMRGINRQSTTLAKCQRISDPARHGGTKVSGLMQMEKNIGFIALFIPDMEMFLSLVNLAHRMTRNHQNGLPC